MTTYAIVDLSNLFGRVRHVVTGSIYDKAGMAILIAFRSIRKLYREHKIDHVVFAVDNGSWRYGVYPQYKAGRKAARLKMKPSDQEEHEVFRDTLNAVIEYLSEKTRCTVLNCKNIEADDMVARWTQIHPNDRHIIVSMDSDFLQLLSPTISLYDGVNDLTIDQTGVRDKAGKTLAFTVATKDGKLKVGKPDPNFIPESEWWRKSLFVKIIRGDSGDGIFSAYPGISFVGTSKRTGIQQAWDDRSDKGFHWNNFFQSTWQKAHMEPDGASTFETVRVIEEYRFNEGLIDLTCQPLEIKNMMDLSIAELLSRPLVQNVGFNFLKFCKQYDQQALGEELDHANYLNAAYCLDI